jgi:hypothetical protein
MGINAPLSGQSLTVLARDIITTAGADVTFMDMGVKEDNTGGWGNFITSLRLDYQGEHVLEGTSAKGEGVISISGDNSTIQVFGYQAESHFTITQQKQAQVEKWNILSKLTAGHNRKYFEKLDEMAYGGLMKSDYAREDSTKLWDDMDDNEKLTWLYELLQKQRAGKKRSFWANVLVVDDRVYSDINTLDYSTYKEGTIAQKISNTFGVKIVGTWRLFEAGTGDSRAMVAFNNNPYSVVNRIPVRLMTSPTSRRGFRTSFETIFRVAGFDILDMGGGIIGDKL